MNQSLARILVPIAAIAIAVFFALSFIHTAPPTPPAGPPATAPAPATTAPVVTPTTVPATAVEPPATAPATSEASPAIEPATVPITHPAAVTGLHIEEVPVDPVPKKNVSSLGSDDKGSPYKIKVQLVPYGAAIVEISLSEYRTEALGGEPYTLLLPMQAGPYTLFPYAARSVTINGGKPIDIQNIPWRKISSDAPDTLTYRLQILDGRDKPVLQMTRTYSLAKGSYDLRCDQRLENLGSEPLQVIWDQNAQGDVVQDAGIDQRMLVAGYFNLSYNPTRTHVYTEQSFLARVGVLNALADKQTPFWPNPNLAQTNTELAWVAEVNRYFAVVTHPILHPPAASGGPWIPDQWFNPQSGTFAALTPLVIGDRSNAAGVDTRRLVFVLTSRPITLPAGGTTSLDLALYAGPRKSEVFVQPPFAALDFDKLIVYSLSCAFCTFQPLARGLLWLLEVIHVVVRDWGVSIIVLVLLVRLVLHPITKRSQISMTKMGKQMQSLQPEIERIKKKYKDDDQQIKAETTKLYYEKGINPANMLGCLPMVLQMPIWVALYAMLYFAIELRHQPAFYGIFQAISGGHWGFLADLSAPDNFLRFSGEGIKFVLPILNKPIQITGVNILPIFMAVVYYFQQQLMAPPPTNEQAAQQQKMMKWMILLFPIMLYTSPSGLNLYILASTAGGIVDSLIVKRHIKREEDNGTLFAAKPPKPGKPGGWKERLRESLESKQRAIEERQRRDAQKRDRGK